jgi:hypothetical protein
MTEESIQASVLPVPCSMFAWRLPDRPRRGVASRPGGVLATARDRRCGGPRAGNPRRTLHRGPRRGSMPDVPREHDRGGERNAWAGSTRRERSPGPRSMLPKASR